MVHNSLDPSQLKFCKAFSFLLHVIMLCSHYWPSLYHPRKKDAVRSTYNLNIQLFWNIIPYR